MMDRRLRRLLACLSLVPLMAGCVTSKPQVVPQSRVAALSPLPPGDWEEHTAGETVTTGAGNRVTVHEIRARVRQATSGPLPATGVDVEVCVPSNARSPVTFDRDLFRVQVGAGTRIAIPTGDVLSPSLDGITQVHPGQCTRGWLLFLLERGERPDAVLLLASSPVRWHLDRG